MTTDVEAPSSTEPPQTFWKPLRGRVLVERYPSINQSPEGIALVNPKHDQRARVIATYPDFCTDGGCVRHCGVTAGETVVIPFAAGTEIDVGGRKFIAVREDDIIAVETTCP